MPAERSLLCRQVNGRFSSVKDNQRSSKAPCCELSLHAKVCPPPRQPKCFIINTGFCRYKGSEPRKCLSLSTLWTSPPSRAHMSVLILSRELSIFERVFLMRNAVNLADGFWYQHSFMSLAMEVRVWGVGRGRWESNQSMGGA